MTTVAVDRVSYWYGSVIALSDVSFTLESGVTALLGPNGAGKSSLIKLLCGLSAPKRGTVRILGVDPRTDLELSRRLGLVPQSESLFEAIPAFDFVRAMADLAGLATPGAAAEAALRLVHLNPTDRRPVSSYSKGMRQRVKVAQAMVHDPEVVVLDEPLEGLDPRQRVLLIDLFRRLGREGRTVVVSSHVLEEVERFGERVLVLAEGRLVAEGDYRAIRDQMDDRPHRYRVATDRPRHLGAELLRSGSVVGAQVGAEGDLLIDTSTVSDFRRQVAASARSTGSRLLEVVALDDDLDSVFRYLVDRETRNA